MKQTDDLLEQLREHMGLAYISDLYRAFWPARPPQDGAPPPWVAEYSLEAWSRAVFYVTGRMRPFSTPQEAFSLLWEHAGGAQSRQGGGGGA